MKWPNHKLDPAVALMCLLAICYFGGTPVSVAAGPPQEHLVNEDQCESMLYDLYGSTIPPVVRDLDFDFLADQKLIVDGVIDFNYLSPEEKEKLPWILKQFFTKAYSFEVVGVLTIEQGLATFVLERAEIGGRTMPLWVVHSLIPEENLTWDDSGKTVLQDQIPPPVRKFFVRDENTAYILIEQSL